MKLILLLALSLTSMAHAKNLSSYEIKMTCGELVKAGNGKLLKRLEPNFFGTNAKYVLRTKFIAPVDIYERGGKDSQPMISKAYPNTEISYTAFSIFEKFDTKKKSLKTALKGAKKAGISLFACAGHVDVFPFKYSGNEVSFSTESVDDAIAEMRKIGRRHL